MRPELATITVEIARVREDATQRAPTAALLARIDDALTKGYACALAGDSWAMRAEQELQDLISNTELPIRARALRTLAREHALLQRDLIALRRELAALSGDRHRLVTGSAMRSA